MKFRFFLLTAIVCFLLPMDSQGQSAEAALSVQQAIVGQPIILTLRVQNAPGVKMPRNFAVNGLDIRFRSQSQQVSMVNFQSTIVVTYTFLVVAQQAGEFTIPSISIPSKSGTLHTNPLRLIVTDRVSATPSTGPPQAATGGMAQSPSFRTQKNEVQHLKDVVSLQVVLPKGKIYVGQMIPVEIRAYFDARYQYQIDQMPVFSGEGYVVEKLSKPREEQQVINDVPYTILTFETAITPVKQGKLEIEPASLSCSVLVSQPLPDIFGDLFGDALMGQVGSFGDYQNVQAKSEAVTIDVLPLPEKGRPESFSGAIGRFSMTTAASPKKAEAGEPITMKIQIRGQGNFGAMGPPELTNDDGWRRYPPADSFMAEDYPGFTGTKTFEIAMIATQDRRSTPGVEFSFFDPVEGKYETLIGNAIPVVASGNQSQLDKKTALKPDDDKAGPPLTEKSNVSEASLERSQAMAALRPVSTIPRPFRIDTILANSFALLAWVSFLAFCSIRAFYRSPKARNLRMRRVQARLLAEMEQDELSTNQLYGKAAELMRLETIIRTGKTTNVTPRSILEELDRKTQEAALTVLEKAEEMKYGAEHHDAIASASERHTIANLMRCIFSQRANGKSQVDALDTARIHNLLLIAIISIFSTMSVRAEEPNLDIWRAANDAFAQCNWAEAERGYQILLDKGVHAPSLYYNLALVQENQNDIAGAALAMMRAKVLAPSNRQITEQLSRLAKDHQLTVPAGDWKIQIVNVVGVDLLWVGGMIGVWISAFVVVFAIFLSKRKRMLIAMGGITFLFCKILLFIAWTADPLISERNNWMVNTKQAVNLKAMPVTNAERVSELNPGSVVKVISQRGNWIYCALPDGIKGWLQVDSAVPIAEFDLKNGN